MSVLIAKKFEGEGFGTSEERAQVDRVEYELLKAGDWLSVAITDQEIGGGWWRLLLEGEDAAQAAISAVAAGGLVGAIGGFSITNVGG